MSVEEDWFKGKPRVRVWELDKNSTTLDIISAAPSDAFLIQVWWTWAPLAILVGLFSLILGLSIVTSRKARRHSFNLYLVFMAIPDFVFSLCCGITCLLNALNEEYWSGWMCNFQNWYCVFGIGSNAWINACVTRELHLMLRSGGRFRRYRSPTRKYVILQSLAIYLCMGCLGFWGVFDEPNWPFYSGTRSGFACLPVVSDGKSRIYFWVIFMPLFAVIPSVYIIFVTFDVWRRNLLPPSGRRRLLVIYFGRLIVVFYVMWLPTLFTLFILYKYMSPMGNFLGGLWSHLQGAVSAGVSLLKPDIYSAFKSFVTCQPDLGENGDGLPRRASTTRWSASASLGENANIVALGGALDLKGDSGTSNGPAELTEEPVSGEREGSESSKEATEKKIDRIDKEST
jgi:energy-converting hydrogenase Eha subunit A